MLTAEYVVDRLKEVGREVGQQARNGNEKAQELVEAYQFLYASPGDPGAKMLLVVAYEDYVRSDTNEC